MLSFILAAFAVAVKAQDYSTYPQVPQTASINGFADPILSALPACASECVTDSSTSNTPCPYWDTGCLCVMPQFGGTIGMCFASACSGSDVEQATQAAESLCNSVGANTWMIPSSISAQLSTAAANAAAETTSASEAETTSSSSPASSASLTTAEATTTSEAAETSSAAGESSSAAETSSAAEESSSSSSAATTSSAEATTTASSTTSSSASASSTIEFNSGSRLRASVYAFLGIAGTLAMVAL